MKRICIECAKEYLKNEIKRINKKWICVFCWRKNRDNKRDMILHTVGGVRRKKDIMKEVKERGKRERKLRRIVEPTIPGAKRQRRQRQSKLSFYLTREEKYVLYKKYTGMGYEPQIARDKINNIVKRLGELVKRLREEGKKEEEVNRKFKEEFAKLCQKE